MKKYYGNYGGQYVPEMLLPALEELEKNYAFFSKEKSFQKELQWHFKHYVGKPTPLYYAENLTKKLGGAKIYLKLEGHNHTGAHKITNVFGQILLAKRMGKKNVIAETGAGQHGLATATACAKFGFKCKIFMGLKDMKRQYPNVFSMKLLGAEIIAVKEGSQTLKDAVSEALKEWIENVDDSYYLLGSALGPHPYPKMVSDFQSIIGKETKKQILSLEGKLPQEIIACVGGGSNSLGIFLPFLKDKDVRLTGVEAGGKGARIGEHACRFLAGSQSVGIAQGYKSYFLQDAEGQIAPTHSISAGLDYAGASPILARLYEQKRVEFTSVQDQEALEAFKTLSATEGVIPALESAHAVAHAMKAASKRKKEDVIVVNISGRGDKDLFIVAKELDRENWIYFLKNEAKGGK